MCIELNATAATFLRTHTYTHIHARTYIYASTYISTHICAHKYTCTHIHIHTYIYTQIYTHTYTHTCTHKFLHFLPYTHTTSPTPQVNKVMAILSNLTAKFDNFVCKLHHLCLIIICCQVTKGLVHNKLIIACTCKKISGLYSLYK